MTQITSTITVNYKHTGKKMSVDCEEVMTSDDGGGTSVTQNSYTECGEQQPQQQSQESNWYYTVPEYIHPQQADEYKLAQLSARVEDIRSVIESNIYEQEAIEARAAKRRNQSMVDLERLARQVKKLELVVMQTKQQYQHNKQQQQEE